jgi:hypothetical protein
VTLWEGPFRGVAIDLVLRYSATSMEGMSVRMLSLESILLALPGPPGASAD